MAVYSDYMDFGAIRTQWSRFWYLRMIKQTCSSNKNTYFDRQTIILFTRIKTEYNIGTLLPVVKLRLWTVFSLPFITTQFDLGYCNKQVAFTHNFGRTTKFNRVNISVFNSTMTDRLIYYNGVRLCLRTSATNGPFVRPLGDMWACRAIVMIIPVGDNSWLVHQSSLAVLPADGGVKVFLISIWNISRDL
jgi:hypothetical protein